MDIKSAFFVHSEEKRPDAAVNVHAHTYNAHHTHNTHSLQCGWYFIYRWKPHAIPVEQF